MASNLPDVGDSPSQPKDVTHKLAVDVVLKLPAMPRNAVLQEQTRNQFCM